jgi:hypothetical protein
LRDDRGSLSPAQPYVAVGDRDFSRHGSGRGDRFVDRRPPSQDALGGGATVAAAGRRDVRGSRLPR